MTGFPIVVNGTGLSALVVGGGRVAVRRVSRLLAAGLTVQVVAPAISDVLRGREGGTPRLTLTERAYDGDDVTLAHLVVAATDDRQTNARVAADARRAHRLVSVADAPGEGSFVFAATHQTGELIIGVVTGGVPGAAARIRDAIADRFDRRYGEALAALACVRREHLNAGRRASWLRAAQSLLGEGFCAAVEGGEVVDKLRTWR